MGNKYSADNIKILAEYCDKIDTVYCSQIIHIG